MTRTLSFITAALVVSGCSAHRAAMPSGYAMLPSFPAPEELVIAGSITPLGSNSAGYDIRLGGRLTEHLSLGVLASGPLQEAWDPLLPGLQMGLEGSYLWEPLRIDLSIGASQSAFFAAGRVGVAAQHRWSRQRWGLRGAAALFGAAALGAGCGEFVMCDGDGPTRSTLGVEGSLAFGARMAGVEVAIGPRVAVLRAGGHDPELIWGLVFQVDGRININASPLRMKAPEPSPMAYPP